MRRGLGLRRLADFDRISPDRLRDVLELGRAEIAHREIEPRLDLAVGVFRQTDRAGFGDAFQSRGYIDPVARQIAIALLNHIAEMDADAELDASLGPQTGVALDHTILHLDGAAHPVDHAPEFNENPVAGAFDHAPVMHGDGRINQIAPESPEPRQCAILVHAGKPAVADNIRRKNSREFSGSRPRRAPRHNSRLPKRPIQNWPEPRL